MNINFHADQELERLLNIIQFDDFDFAMNEFLKASLYSFLKFILDHRETSLDDDIIDGVNAYEEISLS